MEEGENLLHSGKKKNQIGEREGDFCFKGETIKETGDRSEDPRL